MDDPPHKSFSNYYLANAHLSAFEHYQKVQRSYSEVASRIDQQDRVSANPAFAGMNRLAVVNLAQMAATRARASRFVAIASAVICGAEFAIVPTVVGAAIGIGAGLGAIGAEAISQSKKQRKRAAETELTDRARGKFVDQDDLEILAERRVELDEAAANLAARIADLPSASGNAKEFADVLQIFKDNPAPPEPARRMNRGGFDEGGMTL